jgi:hypothetical protein
MCRYRNLIPAVAFLCAAPSVPERALAQITAIDTGAMTWERADAPGFPEGAMRKLLKIDQETGIGAALRWHPEGCRRRRSRAGTLLPFPCLHRVWPAGGAGGLGLSDLDRRAARP